MPRPKLLIVDDDDSTRTQLRWAFVKDYEVLEATNRQSAIKIIKKTYPDIVLLDLGLPPDKNSPSEGLKALEDILKIDPCIKALVISGYSETQNARKAVTLGAFDFFPKPFNLDEVKIIVKRAFYLDQLIKTDDDFRVKNQDDGFHQFIGTSASMREVFAIIREIAPLDIPALILGETGTGKELAANAIHKQSNRSKGPFVPINCGAIPENLMESELFGHEKGAFTGAHTTQKGKIEIADRGTLFLDEIAELPLSLQVKLLRFLGDFHIRRLGGHTLKKIDVRIIAATNRNIKEMVRKKLFREDLYYRLEGTTLNMPSLREREGDMYLLAMTFARKYTGCYKKKLCGFTNEALSAMRNYSWPGNVRELENKISSAVAMAQTNKILLSDLSIPFSETEKTEEDNLTLIEARETFEKEMIQEMLLKHQGKINNAAAELGITRQYLRKLIKKYKMT